ncbi:hypothetical protein F0562_019774 [Nyssa sinensis]|uniref:Uncharacterized protein n=1 Tax=Nyssa sinensis TaxID=561372 RepID=A0A5J5BQ52_9ASTE|nr:hypothetical protein F0562_019774 [Nyssa sinensis]
MISEWKQVLSVAALPHLRFRLSLLLKMRIGCREVVGFDLGIVKLTEAAVVAVAVQQGRDVNGGAGERMYGDGFDFDLEEGLFENVNFSHSDYGLNDDDDEPYESNIDKDVEWARVCGKNKGKSVNYGSPKEVSEDMLFDYKPSEELKSLDSSSDGEDIKEKAKST